MTSNIHKNMMKNKTSRRGLPMTSSCNTTTTTSSNTSYNPISWKSYYNICKNIDIGCGLFRVYMSKCNNDNNKNIVRIITLHGGGYSALSWSIFTKYITDDIICQVISIDIRGHGNTTTNDDDDLTINTLSNDIVQVLLELFNNDLPPIVLVGHSMGGAIAVRVANDIRLSHIIKGLVVIDVVEGTAMESLSSMQTFLRGRPSYFESVPRAIEWCVRSGQTRNLESARVSMPGQIVNCESGLLASEDVAESDKNDTASDPPTRRPAVGFSEDSIAEDEEEDSEPVRSQDSVVSLKPSKKYTWRINLSRTERHWSGWFKGLSSAFLSCNAMKLLLLASISGLDRELTVGQMQGKFQMQVLTRCGHAVHEDCPEEVARVISCFLLRHKFAESCSDTMDLNVMPAC